MPVGLRSACGVSDTSSTASPSSELGTSTSSHRIQNVAPAGTLTLMVAATAVRFGARFPFSAPTAPAVTGEVKSSAFASTQTPDAVDGSVAVRLY